MTQADAESQDALAAQLARQLESLASSERELRGLLAEAHTQVSERDRRLRELRTELAEARSECARVTEEATRAHAEVAAIKRTRVWRAAAIGRWLRGQVKRRRRD